MKAQDKGQRPLLDDEQWNSIKRISGLPEEARNYIESGIGRYRAWQEEGPKVAPAKTKEKLRKLRSQARELLRGFEEALGHDDVYFALVRVGRNEWHPRNFEQRKKLAEHHRTEKVRADLPALIDWLDQSERALPRRKPGPPAEVAQNVYLFVDSIDNALRHDWENEKKENKKKENKKKQNEKKENKKAENKKTENKKTKNKKTKNKKRLTRSDYHQEMMKEIFEIVDPEVGKGTKVGKGKKGGTIDTAMRQVIDYGKRSDGKLLLPSSRHYRSGRR
jgi:hypothetical protein